MIDCRAVSPSPVFRPSGLSETATLYHSGGTAPVLHRTSLLCPCGHLRLPSMQEADRDLQVTLVGTLLFETEPFVLDSNREPDHQQPNLNRYAPFEDLDRHSEVAGAGHSFARTDSPVFYWVFADPACPQRCSRYPPFQWLPLPLRHCEPISRADVIGPYFRYNRRVVAVRCPAFHHFPAHPEG